MEVLVLESPWDDDISDRKSVRLFVEGWSDISDMHLCYRTYHDSDDLVKCIEKFVKHPKLKVCYIAGHGVGGRLAGADGNKNINLRNIALATKKRGKGGKNNKGILLGSCDVGRKAEKFLSDCGSRIRWVAGYDRETPWFEGTICDLLFIEYMVRGRIRVDNKGTFFKNSSDDFESRRTSSAEIAAKWIESDFSVAKKCGFLAIDRE
jgi:hypothetical protein